MSTLLLPESPQKDKRPAEFNLTPRPSYRLPQARTATKPAIQALIISGIITAALAAGLAVYKVSIILPKIIPPLLISASPDSAEMAEPPTPEPTMQRVMTPPPTASFTPPPPPPVAPPPPPPAPVISVSAEDLAFQATDALDVLEQIAAEEAAEAERKRIEEERKRQELARLEEERKQREREEAAERARLAKIKAARDAELARKRAIERQRQQEIAAANAAKRRAEQERAAVAARERAAQQRQATLAKKVSAKPSLTNRVPPNYPSSARRSGQEGTTMISATITTSGKVSSPRVVSSSGHRSLDSAAVRAVKKWRFHPAKNGLGQPIAHQVNIPVTFRLN
ncbi:MAG: energy transducer TonB [Verrucomicrobiota bacterium JB023]|nr:energy transducer TonB [Verrucomicrobiota bacterium JB023]